MEIPISAATKTFEKQVTFQSFTATVKIDFADYDYDDDGKTEGCSGNTKSTPICFRLWMNGNRLMRVT